jgi:hypothetical protein
MRIALSYLLSFQKQKKKIKNEKKNASTPNSATNGDRQ